jgi:hypothetical protein
MHTTESDVFMYIPSDEESKLLLNCLVVFEPGIAETALASPGTVARLIE